MLTKNISGLHLIALIGLILSACQKYPGHRPSDGVGTASQLPWERKNISTEIPVGGDCHIDSINDEPAEGSKHVLKQGLPMSVSGWGAISVTDGIVASNIALSLKNKSTNTRVFAVTTPDKRRDVADYFKSPKSIDTGFKSMIDISDLSPGDYILEVIQHKNEQNLRCRYAVEIIIKR
jgi:hypothetical protein